MTELIIGNRIYLVKFGSLSLILLNKKLNSNDQRDLLGQQFCLLPIVSEDGNSLSLEEKQDLFYFLTQIKSLEDIVARRNTGNNNGCSIPEHSTKIKQLEIDKDNLIKDNMLLINENKSLKQRISNSSNITIKQ